MQYSAHDGFINIDIPIPDFQVESTIGVGANPGLVVNICPLATEIGQGHQVAGLALLTFGETCLFHEGHLPAKIRFSTVYTNQIALGKSF